MPPIPARSCSRVGPLGPGGRRAASAATSAIVSHAASGAAGTAGASVAAVLLALAAAAPLAAQAPRITPKGDPSVAADTIYRLAVDSATHRDDPAVILLDDGVVRFEADGRSVRTYRTVVQILRPEAADDYREFKFGWAPGHERLTVNWMRVVRPDGSVVSAGPSQVQDADVPATMGDPVYTDRKVRRISLSGVEPGTIVDYSTTTEELKPFLPGDFYTSWRVTTGMPVRRSRLIVDVPAGLPVRVQEWNLDFPRRTATAKGRTVYTWARNDVPKIEGEAWAADSNAVVQHLALASPLTWGDIARWYAGNARGRYTLPPAALEKVRGLVAPARTRLDTLRAVHRWVAQDIRYVSIALGLGGYQPRTPEEVVRTGYGDCKDKATLFVAALGALGVEAYPVLLNSQGGVERALPSVGQFDHAIAAVRRPEGGYLFVDLTASLTPLGELPFSEQGAFALVVHPDGQAEEVTLPEPVVEANRGETRIVGELDEQGLFHGRFETSGTGFRQYKLRNAFENPPDSTWRVDFARAVARGLFPEADGDSLEAFDGKDLQAAAHVSVRIRTGRAATKSGDTWVLHLPLQGMGGYATTAANLEEAKPRRFPIDAEDVLGSLVLVDELRMTLPAGWHARLPDGVTAESAFGRYEVAYTQVGRELRMRRELRGTRGVLPPERVGELIAWMRAVGRDDPKVVVLDRDTAASTIGAVGATH